MLQVGSPEEHGTIAVCSAGTGLGEAFLVRSGEGRRVFPSEGGHADFAPRNETEIELFRFVARDNEHVSYERVCSGIGLVNCYRFLASLDGGARLPLAAATGGVYLGGGIPPKILPKPREAASSRRSWPRALRAAAGARARPRDPSTTEPP